ncbi:MAG: twin-arginine translocase TatA/TatE family subunit [Phycisphaerales bacterium JB039]
MFSLPGQWEWVLLALLGVLLFGRRLPEVGRNVGRSIMEFKKGLREITEEADRAAAPPAPQRRPGPLAAIGGAAAVGAMAHGAPPHSAAPPETPPAAEAEVETPPPAP